MSNQVIWDRKRKELRVGGVVVRRFRHSSTNQERIIRAFAEQGWPSRIDDPLPVTEVNPKSKLHDTIKCLNRSLECNLLKFRGDGTGAGVVLEFKA